jgi:hypothetical protein
MAAIGCGHSKFYELLNSGVLDARRFGKRTYITAESLEAFVERLPRAVTPTIAKAEHEAWAGQHSPKSPQESLPQAQTPAPVNSPPGRWRLRKRPAPDTA